MTDKMTRPINFRVTCEMERQDLRIIHDAYKKARTLRDSGTGLDIADRLNIYNSEKIADWVNAMPVTAYTLAKIRKRLSSDAGRDNAAMGD